MQAFSHPAHEYVSVNAVSSTVEPDSVMLIVNEVRKRPRLSLKNVVSEIRNFLFSVVQFECGGGQRLGYGTRIFGL